MVEELLIHEWQSMYLAGKYDCFQEWFIREVFVGMLIRCSQQFVIFRDMALKGPTLYVCLWDFDCEH